MKLLTKADKWLIIILSACSLIGITGSFFRAANLHGSTVELSVDGKPIRTIYLQSAVHEEFRVSYGNGYNVVEVDRGRVRIREANCPDQLCVHTGWISSPSQQIVCLPYRLVIKIVADAPPELDDISR